MHRTTRSPAPAGVASQAPAARKSPAAPAHSKTSTSHGRSCSAATRTRRRQPGRQPRHRQAKRAAGVGEEIQRLKARLSYIRGLRMSRSDRHGARRRAPLGYTSPPIMAGERIKLEVKERERIGSRESRRLRRDGYVPGVLYGRGMEPHAISVLERELRKVLTGGSGLHAILDVVLEGESTAHPSILKDYQQDPMRGKLVHIDLQEVRLDQPIQATVIVELKGGEEAPGVKEGGVLSQVAREVTVEALPMEVPEHLELDVSGMVIGDTLRLADLPAREGVEGEEAPEGAAEGEAAPEAPAGTGEQGKPGTTES